LSIANVRIVINTGFNSYQQNPGLAVALIEEAISQTALVIDSCCGHYHVFLTVLLIATPFHWVVVKKPQNSSFPCPTRIDVDNAPLNSLHFGDFQ
jgi:hypothetical protein